MTNEQILQRKMFEEKRKESLRSKTCINLIRASKGFDGVFEASEARRGWWTPRKSDTKK